MRNHGLNHAAAAMIAFEVYVNRIKVCTAGIGELTSLFAQANCLRDPDGNADQPQIRFHVSGMDTLNGRMWSWVNYPMGVGDRIEIKVVDARATDEPTEVQCNKC